MILSYCTKCKYHEAVEIDSELHSKCNKENCIAIYSNCVRIAAVEKFIGQNNIKDGEELSSALEICYPTV